MKPGNHDARVVPTNDLADVIEPYIQRIEARHFTGTEQSSPFSALYHEVSEAMGTSEDVATRRLYSIRQRQTVATGIALAEAYLNALDLDLNVERIPQFPRSVREASEIAEVWCPEMTLKERCRFADYLLHFSNAYLRESADPETLEFVKKQTDRRRPGLQAMRARRRAERQATAVAA